MYEVHKALKIMSSRIDDKIKQLEEALGARAAKDFEQYCGMCGEITGLLTARSYMSDLTRKLEEEDE